MYFKLKSAAKLPFPAFTTKRGIVYKNRGIDLSDSLGKAYVKTLIRLQVIQNEQ